MDFISGGSLRTSKAKADESSPFLKVHAGELVVAEGVGTVARVVGVDQILIVSEVLQHADEVITGVGLNLVLLHPVEELLFVVRTIVDIARRVAAAYTRKVIRKLKELKKRQSMGRKEAPI